MRSLIALFCVVSSSAGPAIYGVSLDCEKKLFCPTSTVNLVAAADAAKPQDLIVASNLAPAEKSKLARETRTLTAKDASGAVYALVMDPSQPSAVLLTLNGTTSSSVPAAAALSHARTLSAFPAPVGLVASTADGKLYAVDASTGGVTALPVALPAGLENAGVATTDGASRLFLVCNDHDPAADDDPVAAQTAATEAPQPMYVAALGLLRNTATLSEGAPHDSSTDSTTCVGLHYNATHSAGPLTLDSAAAIVSTILGPALGTLNLANASDFTVLPAGLLGLVYLGYDAPDALQSPQATFLDGEVFYAAMDYDGTDDDDGATGARMTWVDFSAPKKDRVINFAEKADRVSTGLLVA